MFRKKTFKVALQGGAPAISRVVTEVDGSLNEIQKLVSDTPESFASVDVDPEIFSLKNKVENGVHLEEVDSVCFKSDSLSDSEMQKINDVLNEDTNPQIDE